VSAPEQPEAPAPPGPRCAVFCAGGERFGLALDAVRAVVLPQPPFARVPRSGPAVKGAMNLRGRIVPVVDLAALLGLAPAADGERDAHVLVLESERGGMGLLVGAVLGVEALRPERAAAGGPASGVATSRHGAVTLLDAGALQAAAASHFGARPAKPVP
jgi:purine-binding chemotaxis protein CheW